MSARAYNVRMSLLRSNSSRSRGKGKLTRIDLAKMKDKLHHEAKRK
jgi:hypothetical protein